jgi:ribosomal protein S21
LARANDDQGSYGRRQGEYRRDGGEARREGSDPRRDFEREVRKLKKDFQRNVLPAVKRHSFYVSKSEMRRVKERKADRRRRRQIRKFETA